MTQFNDNMIVLGETKKRGDGVNAVLTLMKDVRDFQEKVDACVEAQINPANKTAIQGFSGDIEKMYSSLLDMAKGGVRTMREPEERTEGVVEEEGRPVEKGKVTVSPPTPPKM